jgi:hypothetical protein
MALSSMTGFARSHGVAGAYAWAWEIKSVNAKGLDLRFRLPAGWDAVEVPSRARGTEKLSRGTVYANLTVERKGTQPTVKVNEPVLGAVLSALKGLSGKVQAAPPTLDGILSLKGVIEVTEEDESEEDHRAAETAIISGFEEALAALLHMRQAEGKTLGGLLSRRLDEIAASPHERRVPRAQAGSNKGASCRPGVHVAPGIERFDWIGSTRRPSCLLPKPISAGARPSYFAYRAGEEALGERRRDRPQARLSGAGIASRIKYADRQGQ